MVKDVSSAGKLREGSHITRQDLLQVAQACSQEPQERVLLSHQTSDFN